jgi:broad specificity phosphatase PhoE
MKNIIFESHATSVDNENRIASGHNNSPLSNKGILQAKEMGERYKTNTIDLICCSDLDRSLETARIAFSHRKIPILLDARLREWDYGKFNGASADMVESLKIMHVYDPFPEGESLSDAVGRINDFLDQFNQTNKALLIIGHRAIFYALEQKYKKCTLQEIVSKPWNWQPGWYY